MTARVAKCAHCGESAMVGTDGLCLRCLYVAHDTSMHRRSYRPGVSAGGWRAAIGVIGAVCVAGLLARYCGGGW